MSKATKNEEAKQTAKQGLDKDKDLTLREKTLKQATGLMGELTGKYKALEKELRDKKKGMSNPDSPRNKKQLREIEKKMKAVGDNMDRIQKAMDKNSRGFNAEKKKPGDKAMKKIAEQVDAEGMKKRESENKSAKDTAKAEKAIKEFNKKIDSVRGSKKHGSNIEDDAKEMGLEPWQIQIAKDEGVTTLIGLRTLEKNTRGLKNREEYERDKKDSAFPWRSASDKSAKPSEKEPKQKSDYTDDASDEEKSDTKSSITLGNIRKDDDGTLLPNMKETNAIVRYLGKLDDSDPEKVISQIQKKFGNDASFPDVVYNILEDNNYHGINAILNDNGMFSKVGDANKKFEAYRKKYSFEDD